MATYSAWSKCEQDIRALPANHHVAEVGDHTTGSHFTGLGRTDSRCRGDPDRFHKVVQGVCRIPHISNRRRSGERDILDSSRHRCTRQQYLSNIQLGSCWICLHQFLVSCHRYNQVEKVLAWTNLCEFVVFPAFIVRLLSDSRFWQRDTIWSSILNCN